MHRPTLVILLSVCFAIAQGQPLTISKGNRTKTIKQGDYLQVWLPHRTNDTTTLSNFYSVIGTLEGVSQDSIIVAVHAGQEKSSGGKYSLARNDFYVKKSQVTLETFAKSSIWQVARSASNKARRTRNIVTDVCGVMVLTGIGVGVSGLATDDDASNTLANVGVGMILTGMVVGGITASYKTFPIQPIRPKIKPRKLWKID